MGASQRLVSKVAHVCVCVHCTHASRFVHTMIVNLQDRRKMLMSVLCCEVYDMWRIGIRCTKDVA